MSPSRRDLPRAVLPLAGEQPLFDAAELRALENLAMTGLPDHRLMQRAGEQAASLARAVAPHARRIWVAAGPGNNGGDGLEAAVHLFCIGLSVEVSLLGDAARLPTDAAHALNRARATGLVIRAGTATPEQTPDLTIDALLGIGASRAPEGDLAKCILAMNELGCPILAIDLPSGIEPGTGRRLGVNAVVATHTLAMLRLSPGLFTGDGRDHSGTIWHSPLGVPSSVDPPTAWLSGMPAPITPRRHAQHKGSFGDVVVVGGSQGMVGAALLAGRAALAAGAGRVFIASSAATEHTLLLDPSRPELMFRSLSNALAEPGDKRRVVVCGCGGGDALLRKLHRLVTVAPRLLLDADGLNAVANDAVLADLLRRRAERHGGTILTPHPLEAARLLGCSTDQVQADRLDAANLLVQRFRAVVVLKGSGTIIAAPGMVPRINSTGNASLASAGTGDVLAGWTGGRWAGIPEAASLGAEQSLAFSVACHAAAEHGNGADPSATRSVRAADLIDRLHNP